MTSLPASAAASAAYSMASPAAALRSAGAASGAISHAQAGIWGWVVEAWSWLVGGWPHEYVPSLIALAAFLWTLIAFLNAKKRERFKLGIDLMMKLGDRFESAAMREQRVVAAFALATKRKGDIPALDTVLDFFEEVAFLWRRGAVDVESVYEYFSYWLELYTRASADYRADSERLVHWEGLRQLERAVAQFDDWKLSRWRPRWRLRFVHAIAWRLGRGSDEIRRWDGPDAHTASQLKLERRLLEKPAAHAALGLRRVKLGAARG